MQTPSDRLRQLRQRKGYASAAEAARAFGWNEHTYKSHENGNRGIPLAQARKYAAAFGASVMYLLSGSEKDSPIVNHVMFAPLLGRVSAGTFVESESDSNLEVPVPAVPRKDVPAGGQYSLLVDGQSVNRRIPDGAYAICARLDSYPGGPQHGDLVHVVRERAGLYEHTIKELRFTRNGRVLFPVSTDPRFQEQVQLSADEDDALVRIEGVVLGAYTPF